MTPGTPVGHLLPVTRGINLIRKGLDKKTNKLIVSGSKGEPIWREDFEVEEIMIEGEWSGGGVDAEWQRDWPTASEKEHVEASEEEDADCSGGDDSWKEIRSGGDCITSPLCCF